MTANRYQTQPGSRYPRGAAADAHGVNFSTFSRNATSVELLLYERADSSEPFQVIGLDPELNRTFFSWHIYIEGLPVGTAYTWRVDGPGDTRHTGFRFERRKELSDPWSGAVSDALWERKRAVDPQAGANVAMRSIVIADDDYDWEGDQPLNHHMEDMVIYELHVGGFTRHPSAQVGWPGTYAGLIDKIPYLEALGVTDVELMPVMAFDVQDVPLGGAGLGLRNYWGYSTHSYFSPHPGYCVSPAQGTQRKEFRGLVKALHAAGIGVILDVVFNHTAEGGTGGPSISFKGFGNEIFYHLDPEDRRVYRDFTGCGNTVNCNHPVVAAFIVECLEYWVREMHVDGFRFDLASVLARGEDGNPLYHAPVLWSIELSQALTRTKIIAEAWDAGGLYQVGGFPGFRWAEWNGRYRDVIRRFVRGDRGLVAEVATRLSGSSDLYEPGGRLPINSINFVTCHDGFTLYDLVSYNHKHNEANGEDNRDGSNDNLSCNYGVEGDTDDREILSLRRQQAKNFAAVLLLSHGVPMLLAGDEVLQTQRGNNNAYCQDNELGWFDWTLVRQNQGILRFFRQMIAFRRRHPCLLRRRFLNGNTRDGWHLPDVSWHGTMLNEPLWDDPGAQFLAYTLAAVSGHEEDLHILLNMSDAPVEAPLPKLSSRRWHRAVDTSLASPGDVVPVREQIPWPADRYRVQPRSAVVMEGREAL